VPNQKQYQAQKLRRKDQKYQDSLVLRLLELQRENQDLRSQLKQWGVELKLARAYARRLQSESKANV